MHRVLQGLQSLRARSNVEPRCDVLAVASSDSHENHSAERALPVGLVSVGSTHDVPPLAMGLSRMFLERSVLEARNQLRRWASLRHGCMRSHLALHREPRWQAKRSFLDPWWLQTLAQTRALLQQSRFELQLNRIRLRSECARESSEQRLTA